jgi:tetratricopeptide (TPR) repeat protein
MLSLIRGRGEHPNKHRPDVARALAEANALAEARHVARRLLDDPMIDGYGFWSAASLLLDHSDAAAAEDVFQAAVSHSAEHCAQAAPLLADAGREDLADELLRRVLEPSTSFEVLAELADTLREDGRHELAAATIDVALPRAGQTDSMYQVAYLVRALTAVGRRDEAITLARSAFVREIAADHYSQQVMPRWLEAGGESSGADIVAEALKADMKAERRVQIAGELAEAGLLKEATAVWLDVVRWHGDAVDQGIAAASQLVACGYRNRVIETVTTALADMRLLPTTCIGLRAVLAWTVFSSSDATIEELQNLLDG